MTRVKDSTGIREQIFMSAMMKWTGYETSAWTPYAVDQERAV